MMWAKISLAALVAVLAIGVAIVSAPGPEASGVAAINLGDDDDARRDEDALTDVDGSDDDGDGDNTRGNDGTGGGNNTGDRDATVGNDGTAGGDNSYVAAPSPGYGGGDSGGGGSTG